MHLCSLCKAPSEHLNICLSLKAPSEHFSVLDLVLGLVLEVPEERLSLALCPLQEVQEAQEVQEEQEDRLDLVLALVLEVLQEVQQEQQEQQQEQQEPGTDVLFDPSALQGCRPRHSAGSLRA